ncbi:MAG TPA: hypothetical protein EYQ68_08190 [Cytophagales bacterium]|nr:hypothetical protein [Cytophagales bacterium]
MYLSSLQKFILKKALSNINSESLTLYSDAQESSVIKSKNKTDTLKKKLLTSSINEFLKIKKEIEMNQIKYSVTNFGIIEINSNTHAHIYFFEPIIKFYKIKPKDNFIEIKDSIFENISENRKQFEIKKRKYIRVDGNHIRGVIRGESKIFKKTKASVSRTYKTLINKGLLRKINIINYNKEKIGIGFNLTKAGYKISKII